MTTASLRLTALLVLVVLTAGCVADDPEAGASTPETETPAATPSATATDSPAETATPGHPEHAASQPAPNKSVDLYNEGNRTVEIQVTVVREATNATVHDDSYELTPGAETEVPNVTDPEPGEIESFRIEAATANDTASVRIETSACYGDALVEVQADGSLFASHAIC